jgi:FkbM family methyltransferase
MISYAQNYEDLILNRIFKDQPKGVYVDVGANEPIKDNVTYHFYLKGWIGLNFEPNQAYFKKLQEIRPNDISFNFGCSDKEEVLEFKEILDTGLSTFSNEFDSIINSLDFKIIKHQIKCVPIKNIFKEQKITTIDFMSVDVEGFEFNVLKGNDWDKYRPKVIVLEGVAPTRQDIITYTSFQSFLENVDYKLRYFDGLNVFFTDNKNINIPNSCFYPPNCFDDFRQYSTIKDIEKIKDENKKDIEKINDENKFYSANKLNPSIMDKLIKLRTKDIIYIFFKRLLKKFKK